MATKVTKVCLHGLPDLKVSAGGENDMTIEFTLDNDGLADDLLDAVLRHYGIARHDVIIKDLLVKPAVLDRMAAEKTAKEIDGK